MIPRFRKTVATLHLLNDPVNSEVSDWIRMDATVLSLQRAVEALLDLANHLISANGRGRRRCPRIGRCDSHATPETSALQPELVPNEFVLVDFEVRPGIRNYRLVKLPANDPWRIRIGAFQRRVHRAFVVLARRIARSLTAPAASVQVARPRGGRVSESCVRV